MTSPRVALAAALILLSITSVLTGAGQAATGTGVQAFLRTQLHASDSELSSLSEGQAVVKNLPATTKREMTTAGGVRIRGAAITRFVEQFKTLEGFRTSQFVLQIRKFAEQPQHSRSRPAGSGRRGHRGVARSAASASVTCSCRRTTSAASTPRSIGARRPPPLRPRRSTRRSCSRISATYRTGGVSRLVHYNDRETPISLADETTALLDARPSLLDQMPAFQ